jgi:hypothetical protein
LSVTVSHPLRSRRPPSEIASEHCAEAAHLPSRDGASSPSAIPSEHYIDCMMSDEPPSPGQHRVLFAATDEVKVVLDAAPASMTAADDADEEDSFTGDAVNLAESFKNVRRTDAESFVKGLASSPLQDRLRRVFNTYDIDKNGAISKEEVVSMARTLRISMPEETVMELMEGADVDQNGEVDFEEVCCRQRIGNWDPCTL